MAPRRSWAKANNPIWSQHVVAWYQGALEAEHYCRKHDLSTTSLMRWARQLLSADDLRKGIYPENIETAAEERAVEAPKGASALSLRRAHGQRSDCASGVLEHACEAMNFSGMGHAEYAAALDLSPHSVRIWRDRLEQYGNEMDCRSLIRRSAHAQQAALLIVSLDTARNGRAVEPSALH
jgi:hypothetical protein